MRVYHLLLALLILQSCKTNDDVICNFDPIPLKNVFIKLVDTNGNNLIENNTYIKSDIQVTFNGFTNTNPFFENIPKLKNLIAVTATGNEGDNNYEIKLSSTKTDTLILNLTENILGSESCPYSIFTVNTANYNGITQNLEDFYSSDYLITVIK